MTDHVTKAREFLRVRGLVEKAETGDDMCGCSACRGHLTALAALLDEVAAEARAAMLAEFGPRGLSAVPTERVDALTARVAELERRLGEPTPAMIEAGVAYRLKTTVGGKNNWHTHTTALWRVMAAVAAAEGATAAPAEALDLQTYLKLHER